MSDLPKRFDHVRRWSRIGRLLATAGLAAFAVMAVYLFVVDGASLVAQTESVIAQHLVGLVGFAQVLLAVAVIAGAMLLAAGLIFLWCIVSVVLKTEANTFRMYDALRDVLTVLDEQRTHLKMLAENSQLTDAGRDITHRSKERTALRLAINEEIIRGDWEAAYSLVERLESRHGYKNEAVRLREEVDQSRERARLDRVHEAVEQVRARMAKQDWDRARREMDRLRAEHPENPEVSELPDLFTRLRGEHKRRLLKAWDEAVQRNEVDRGIDILKELDQYLTPSEAAAHEEAARGVFRTKLHNLGVQFSLAVTDHDWAEALTAGQEIIREFPNSRMAQEVKQRIHVLEARVEEAASAAKSADVAKD